MNSWGGNPLTLYIEECSVNQIVNEIVLTSHYINVALWTGNENEGNGHLLKMLFIFTTVWNVKRTLKRISSLFIGHKGFVQKTRGGTGKVCWLLTDKNKCNMVWDRGSIPIILIVEHISVGSKSPNLSLCCISYTTKI